MSPERPPKPPARKRRPATPIPGTSPRARARAERAQLERQRREREEALRTERAEAEQRRAARSAPAEEGQVASAGARADSRPVGERIQKILAQAGVASRRAAEELIREGHVTINGVPAELGERVNLAVDAVKVDGRRIMPPPEPQYYFLLNKPKGYLSTREDPVGRPTVMDLLPAPLRQHVVPVGRLDFDTEGLLILTDDGALAQRIAHPRYGCHKTYEVKVKGEPSAAEVEKLRRGIVLDGKRTLPAEVDMLRRARPRQGGERQADEANTWWRVVLGEGRSRQIREMFFRIGHPVQKLRRVAIGPLEDTELLLGAWRELTPGEVAVLRRATAQVVPRPSTRPTPRRAPSVVSSAIPPAGGGATLPVAATPAKQPSAAARVKQPSAASPINRPAARRKATAAGARSAARPAARSSARSAASPTTGAPRVGAEKRPAGTGKPARRGAAAAPASPRRPRTEGGTGKPRPAGATGRAAGAPARPKRRAAGPDAGGARSSRAADARAGRSSGPGVRSAKPASRPAARPGGAKSRPAGGRSGAGPSSGGPSVRSGSRPAGRRPAGGSGRGGGGGRSAPGGGGRSGPAGGGRSGSGGARGGRGR